MGDNAHSESFVCYICNNLIPIVVPSAEINNVLVNLKTIKIRIFLRTDEGNSGHSGIPLQLQCWCTIPLLKISLLKLISAANKLQILKQNVP